jgi:hypothetical protein
LTVATRSTQQLQYSHMLWKAPAPAGILLPDSQTWIHKSV